MVVAALRLPLLRLSGRGDLDSLSEEGEAGMPGHQRPRRHSGFSGSHIGSSVCRGQQARHHVLGHVTLPLSAFVEIAVGRQSSLKEVCACVCACTHVVCRNEWE